LEARITIIITAIIISTLNIGAARISMRADSTAGSTGSK